MAKASRPNILILWGDNIGWWNTSYHNRAAGKLVASNSVLDHTV